MVFEELASFGANWKGEIRILWYVVPNFLQIQPASFYDCRSSILWSYVQATYGRTCRHPMVVLVGVLWSYVHALLGRTSRETIFGKEGIHVPKRLFPGHLRIA